MSKRKKNSGKTITVQQACAVRPGRRPKSKWGFPVALGISGAGAAVWVYSNWEFGVGLTLLAAVLRALILSAKEAEETLHVLPWRGVAALSGGCLWVTVASAFLVACLLRLTGVPAVEAVGTCYVVLAGVSGLMGILLSQWKARRGFRFELS